MRPDHTATTRKSNHVPITDHPSASPPQRQIAYTNLLLPSPKTPFSARIIAEAT